MKKFFHKSKIPSKSLKLYTVVFFFNLHEYENSTGFITSVNQISRSVLLNIKRKIVGFLEAKYSNYWYVQPYQI